MNYELLKRRMAKFFSETSAEDLISKFQDLGYEFYQFSPSPEIWVNGLTCKGGLMEVSTNPYRNSWRMPPTNKKNKFSKKDPETSWGLLFFVRLCYDTSSPGRI